MCAARANDKDFTALKTALLQRPDGDRELAQILSVLVLFDQSRWRSAATAPAPTRLSAGLWAAGNTVYVCWQPSRPDWKNRNRILGEVASALQGFDGRKSIRRLVAVIPDALPGSLATRRD